MGKKVVKGGVFSIFGPRQETIKEEPSSETETIDDYFLKHKDDNEPLLIKLYLPYKSDGPLSGTLYQLLYIGISRTLTDEGPYNNFTNTLPKLDNEVSNAVNGKSNYYYNDYYYYLNDNNEKVRVNNIYAFKIKVGIDRTFKINTLLKNDLNDLAGFKTNPKYNNYPDIIGIYGFNYDTNSWHKFIDANKVLGIIYERNGKLDSSGNGRFVFRDSQLFKNANIWQRARGGKKKKLFDEYTKAELIELSKEQKLPYSGRDKEILIQQLRTGKPVKIT